MPDRGSRFQNPGPGRRRVTISQPMTGRRVPATHPGPGNKVPVSKPMQWPGKRVPVSQPIQWPGKRVLDLVLQPMQEGRSFTTQAGGPRFHNPIGR